MSLKAIVKSVISGDSLVLRGRAAPQGQPPKERVLHLGDIVAPRLGTSSREDEPWAFESREFLRALTVGKEISFATSHSLPAGNDGAERDIGTAQINGVDLAAEVLKNGWAKTKESKRDLTEEDQKRRDLEQEAKTAGKGLWNPHGPPARTVNYNMPEDPAAFVTQWKGKPIDAIVEQVRDGTTLRVRLLMPEGEHQIASIGLAGVRSPRSSGKPGESSEQWGDEAKFFTESRLLQRAVRVTVLSLPTSTATPFSSSGTASPNPVVSFFIGLVLHPAGNVAEHLVAAGLARVVDWHAGMLASSGGMEKLRAAEKAAKERRLCLYANAPAPIASAKSGGGPGGSAKHFDATVIRVWSGDQISVVQREGSQERRLQLSSTRGPKLSDPRQAFYAQEAKEFLRKKLIGKHVKVTIDFVRPQEGEFDERECATIHYGNQNANVAEQLIEKGLASVVRHRRDDENRSSEYDKLIAAEQGAQAETRGIHSGKEMPAPKAPLNISETANRATPFLNGFKRQGKIPAIVDYVAAGSRFRIYLPRDNQILTLVLAGIRAPRNARPGEKGEPYGAESTDFATRKCMQRECEFEVETTDKSGGFIGALYVNKENIAITLVKEGLATIHDYSAEGLSWAKQLTDAEAEAKQAHRNIWKDYDESAEVVVQETEDTTDTGALKTEYIDVIISDVRTQPSLAFSVQVLNTEGIKSLEKLMQEFSLHHKQHVTPAGFVPKGGDLVSAKFSDGQWYRAKIRRASPVKKEAEVTFIDYGNQDTLPFSAIRPLDSQFRSLPGQAQDARLSFIKFVGSESEYYQEAIDRFRSLCEGRKLIANIDHREGHVLHLRLMDPSNPDAAQDPLACINADLVSEGLASIDKKGCRYLSAYPQVVKRLQESVKIAKRDRAGMFEFGDVEEDD